MPTDEVPGEDPFAALLGDEGVEALAEVVDLLERLGVDPATLPERLDPVTADQLVTGLSLVAGAVTRLAAEGPLGERVGADLDAPESREAARRRREGEKIVVHDDDTRCKDETGT